MASPATSGTITPMRATKSFKTGSTTIGKVNDMGASIKKFEGYLTKGQEVLDVFGLGQDPNTRDQAIMDELDELQVAIESGFNDVQDRLDELQLAASLSDIMLNMDYKYKRIIFLCNQYANDSAKLDYELKQLLTTSIGLTIIEEMMSNIYQATDIMLGDMVWSISETTKSIGDIIRDADAEKAGNERFGYLNAAVQYYSYNLARLYQGLFVVNFIQAYFDPNPATDTVSPYVARAQQFIEMAEERSPLTAYQDYFEMKIYAAIAPHGYSGRCWFLMTCGEYLMYDIDNHSIRDGPYRLGCETGSFKPPARFSKIPADCYYPDAVYSVRGKSGRDYDDYYYFLKGNKCVEYLSDDARTEYFTIPNNLPCKDGTVAAMVNPSSNTTFLYDNYSSSEVRSYKLTNWTWYKEVQPSYTTINVSRSSALIDGGGVWMKNFDEMCAFSGRQYMMLNASGGVVKVGMLTDLLPSLVGGGSPWHIEELMSRDSP